MNYFSDWTLDDVKRHEARLNQKNEEFLEKMNKPQRNKYHNERIEVDGVKFDSKKEARRADELKLQERLGLISNLEMQKKFVLQPSFKFMGKTIKEIYYLADFVYNESGQQVVEDVKSPITRKNPVYKLKKKMMMYVHGIEIREV